MLRVEAHSLSSTQSTPRLRSRRLQPTSPPPRRNITPSRHELLPPPRDELPPPRDETSASELAPRLPQPSAPAVALDRWNVRLELQEGELARLYSLGLARGALVWRHGMPEWRPLLTTPELSSLLHRTPIAIHENVELDDEVTLPRPARVPSGVTARTPAHRPDSEPPQAPSTVAPTALDLDHPSPAPARRRVELAAALILGFAAAWLMHSSPSSAPAATALAAPPAPASLPAPPAAVQPAPSLLLAIPTISVADLPLLGEAAPVRAVGGRRRVASRSSVGGAGPSRGDLVGALLQVGRAASSCGERGGPVRVVVSFTNSGVARGIQVSGADLPASTRSCIIGAASRARIPAFSGDPITVSKTL